MRFFSEFFKCQSSEKPSKPAWVELTSIEQVHDAIEQSEQTFCLFFKHSSRCSISHIALERFERNWDLSPEYCAMYYIDLLRHRDISNLISQLTGVEHQSPQTILVHKGQVVAHSSHNGIHADDIIAQIVQNK